MNTPCPTPTKVKHRDRDAAWDQIMAIKAAEGHGDKYLRPYRCGDHWHTGHKPGTGKGGLNGKIQRALKGASR